MRDIKLLEIKTDNYQIWYAPESSTVFFEGVLRLAGMEEYRPIMDLLMRVMEESTQVIINLKELEFLNSSGISMLSMFVIRMREKGTVHLIFKGSNKILWQTKSLKNLQRLMPSLELDFN